MVIIVEICNILYICTANEVSEVIMNFIALAIIADFDDFFYQGLPKELFAKL